MKQECPIINVYSTWVMYVAGIAGTLYFHKWALAAYWIIFVPVGLWVYVRLFPRISAHVGYGRVDDKSATSVVHSPVRVRFYTALGCPFCPIIEQRLAGLQQQMGFTMEKIDVTLKPGLLAEKGIRSVPVVEVGDERIVGHATSEQLAQLVQAHSVEASAAAS